LPEFWIINLDNLGKPQINIVIDVNNETYSLDVQHCSIQVMYFVLRSVVERIEQGEFFTDNIEAIDSQGNSVDKEQLRAIIQEIKEEFENKIVSSTESGVSIYTNDLKTKTFNN
jgi:hypothetical protein